VPGELGIDPLAAVRVVVATVAMYLLFVALVRISGQRSLVALSGYELACVAASGAVLGRTTLLEVPTLGTGVVALTTLFAVQRLLGRCRRSRAVRRLLDRDPVLLMDAGGMQHEAMRRVRVTEDEVRQRLRLAGIGDPREVGWVVLERSGQISVVRASSGLDPALLTDVRAQAHDRAA
jgi:uncharacterized membrane protein YcaP (DUF421 family)